MLTLLKLIMILLFLGGLGLVGYAYLGDMAPEQTDITEPVKLENL